MSNKLSAPQVEAAIQRFWHAFAAKDSRTLEAFYAPEATVVSSSSSRYEFGAVCAARRHREYFQRSTTIKVRIGNIHIEVVGEHGDVAVATYTFQFHATDVVTASGLVEEDIQLGRASHIFVARGNGELRIVHEHLSLPTWPSAGIPIPPAYMPEAVRRPL